MAEPQWIVSNREDGTNVNDWHWVEKDCLPYVKRAAAERCPRGWSPAEGVTLDTAAEVTGEATANNRRGKTIFLYELEFTFRCTVPGAQTATVVFPYVGEDNEDDVYEVKVTSKVPEARDKLAPPLRAAVKEIVAEMKNKFTKRSKGESKLADDAVAAAAARGPASPAPAAAAAAATKPAAEGAAAATAAAAKYRGSGVDVEMEERFTSASPEELYECFLDPQRMSAVTLAQASIEARPGGKFALFGGAVSGEFVDLVRGERIVQTWRFNTWPAGHSSLVEIKLRRAATGDTVLELHQSGVPAEDRERTEHGWHANFWDRMRSLFGYGGQSHF